MLTSRHRSGPKIQNARPIRNGVFLLLCLHEIGNKNTNSLYKSQLQATGE